LVYALASPVSFMMVGLVHASTVLVLLAGSVPLDGFVHMHLW
jgi:hypothetical protein